MLTNFFQAVENTSIASQIRGDFGWIWLFPTIETVHVLSLGVVFGSIMMVDLRLLGVASRNNAITRLSGEMLPYTWSAFLLAAISGTLLFMSKAHTYYYNLQFRLKFLFIALAGINMLLFHFGVYRRVQDWDLRLPPPMAARLAGAISIALWIGVIFMGRWIGFTT